MTAVIAGYARTPFARFNGSLAAIPAATLGAHAITAALSRAGIDPEEVQRVFAGQVLQAGAGQNPARQAAVGSGIPLTVPAVTLNAVCLSGIEAVAAGVRLIESGEVDVVAAVGQESMSMAPHAWTGSRAGAKYGGVDLVDTLEFDGLTDAFERRSMGEATEEGNTDLGLGRAEQDALAAASHQRAAAARAFHAGEIAPYEVPSRGGTVSVAEDDGVRAQTTTETLAKLRPAFGGDTVTAGNASQITDGAAAVVLVSEAYVRAHGINAIAAVESTALVAGPDLRLHAQPAQATHAALAKAGATAADLAAVEINEAFAAVGVHSTNLLGIDPEIVNAKGGAIALGHPIGASGVRIVGTLARRLADLGPGKLGAASICGGGGQGSAVLLRSL